VKQETSEQTGKTIDTRLFLLSLAIVTALETGLGWLAPRFGLSPLWLVGVARMLEVCLLFLIFSWKGKGLASLGLVHGRILFGTTRGFIWSGLFGLLAALVFALLHAAHLNPLSLLKTPLPSSTGGIVLFFIVGGLIAPFAEEVFFRGIVFGFLRRWGFTIALVGTTLLFASAHLGAGIPVTQVVGGLVFAVAYEKEKNLLVPVMIHVLGNTAIFTLSLIVL